LKTIAYASIGSIVKCAKCSRKSNTVGKFNLNYSVYNICLSNYVSIYTLHFYDY
jgi:hypothetical protein